MSLNPTDVLIGSIVEQAKIAYPKEACGFVLEVSGEVFLCPCANVARNPYIDFEIAPSDEAKAAKMGAIVAVYHSHPDSDSGLTDTDLAASEATEYTYICVGFPNTRSISMHHAGKIDLPYTGRMFQHGVVDCYTLIRDYYSRELGIVFPNFFRQDSWWEKGQNIYEDNLAGTGFVPITEVKRHDLLLFKIRSRVSNHAAIALGDGTMLHHLYGRLSKYDSLVQFARFLTGTYRHSSLIT